MKVDPYLHAVLLLHGAGQEVSADKIVAVLKAAGAEADEAKAKVLAEAVKDLSIDDLVKEAAVAPVAAAPAAAPASQEAAAPKEEEPSEEKKEEEAAAGLANLFG
ncbi:MAG: 50S ribosomal protein P1 [Bdellovibrio sp.]|nr:MAG: 50S ribosomal protein P1 [Bdellovibrio sp.]